MSTRLNDSMCRPLRILIVDDNHINLSVLSTLLKRRFSHLIDGAPVSVDSGLKAIQLLRTHIFDCIFMDIQMPFLSGIDATRRIRNSEDGILPANSDAHIVAVTTAIGDEPELAYRRARMDGMIGKPVRYDQLHQYLLPLSVEAHKAAPTVLMLNQDGEDILPPLPPASNYERVFYLPTNSSAPSTRPDICDKSDFEGLLHSQTRESLRRRFNVKTSVYSDALFSPYPLNVGHDPNTTLVEEEDGDDDESALNSTSSSQGNSSSSPGKIKQSSTPKTPPTSSPTRHNRVASMTISQRMLSKQILREVANADFNGAFSEKGIISRSTTSSVRHAPSRPSVKQRNSSPGWLLSDDAPQDASIGSSPLHTPNTSTLSSLLRHQDSQMSGECSESSQDSSLSISLRRVSESGTSSSSTTSDSSSTVTTPACDSPVSFWGSGASQAFRFARNHERSLSNTTANHLSSDTFDCKVKETWDGSSDTALADSSTLDAKSIVVPVPTNSPLKQHTPIAAGRQRQHNNRHSISIQELAQSIHQVDLTS